MPVGPVNSLNWASCEVIKFFIKFKSDWQNYMVIWLQIYLYEIDKIDLLDEVQKTDNWEDWYYILNSSVIEDILNK